MFVLSFAMSGEPWFVLLGLIGTAIAAPLLSLLFLKSIEQLAPIRVRVEGIETYDGFGRKVFVRWQDIKRTRNMILWPGLKWLLLDDGRGYFWLAGIPVFLKDKPAFYRDVVDVAGKDHVIVAALQRNGFGKRSGGLDT